MILNYKPDISHLRVFGCKAFAYNFDITRKKLDDKAKAGIFIGYELNSAAYRIYIPSQRKIMKSGHVVFHDTQFRGIIYGKTESSNKMKNTV
jgi:hypothetical protein